MSQFEVLLSEIGLDGTFHNWRNGEEVLHCHEHVRIAVTGCNLRYIFTICIFVIEHSFG